MTTAEASGLGGKILREWCDDAGLRRPVLVQALPSGWRAISTAVLGGGIGPRSWWLNAQVAKDYRHPDPAAHAREIADVFGLTGAGVALLTAADVSRFAVAAVEGVQVVATVGLGLPVPAAAPPADIAVEDGMVEDGVVEDGGSVTTPPGTINLLVRVPVPLGDAALVNAVVTGTEAKTQALVEAGVPGTGTSSDAVCLACPAASGDSRAEPYGGPRSVWGARIARAVREAVAAGTADWTAVHPPGDPHRRWGRPWP